MVDLSSSQTVNLYSMLPISIIMAYGLHGPWVYTETPHRHRPIRARSCWWATLPVGRVRCFASWWTLRHPELDGGAVGERIFLRKFLGKSEIHGKSLKITGKSLDSLVSFPWIFPETNLLTYRFWSVFKVGIWYSAWWIMAIHFRFNLTVNLTVNITNTIHCRSISPTLYNVSQYHQQ